MEFKLNIEQKEWNEALDKAFKKNVGRVKIDGFRQGKAPRNIYEKKFGKESLYQDAIEIILPGIYTKLIKDNNLEPVANPEIKIDNVSDLGFEVTFNVITKPEFKIKSYKKLKIDKKDIKVTKEEVETEVNKLRETYAELFVKEGAVELNDIANINYEGFHKGVAFPGGKADNYDLVIGSNTFIPGFEEQLIGMNKGEEKAIEVTFPAEYQNEELKGQPVTFNVKINSINTKVIPDLNEEFFEDLDIEDVNSKETLYKYVEEGISLRKEEEAKEEHLYKILDHIAKSNDIDVPKQMIEDEIHNMLHEMDHKLRASGLSLDQYIKALNTTIEEVSKTYEPMALQKIKNSLILDEIAILEGITMTDEEIDAEIPLLTLKYNLDEEQVKNISNNKHIVKKDLIREKVVNILLENN